MLQFNTSLSYYLWKNFHLSSLNSCSPVRQVKFRQILADLEHLKNKYIERELVQDQGKTLYQTDWEQMKDLQSALFGNPKVGLQPAELKPSLVVLDRKVESRFEVFCKYFYYRLESERKS